MVGTEFMYLFPQNRIVNGSARIKRPVAAGILKKKTTASTLSTSRLYSFVFFCSRRYELLGIKVEITEVINSRTILLSFVAAVYKPTLKSPARKPNIIVSRIPLIFPAALTLKKVIIGLICRLSSIFVFSKILMNFLA